MHRIVVLACAALAFGMSCSPLGAQQVTPEQAPPPTQQVGPDEPTPSTQQLPEAAQPVPEAEPLPPPFPPMPRARPSHRWVDMGDHRTSHRHHHTSRAHRATHVHHRVAHKSSRPTHFSRKTIRSCHRMNYNQIMRHTSCRLMMKQELAAATHRKHHRKAMHRHGARRHHAARRHR